MHNYSSPVRVGVIGATGYAGQELVGAAGAAPSGRRRLRRCRPGGLDAAPAASAGPACGTARSNRSTRRAWVSRSTWRFWRCRRARRPNLASRSLPGVRVIDLSGAFRIRDDAARSRWYPATKSLPAGSAYGLVEHYREHVKDASLIACPGCYPTAALLSLLPLKNAGAARSVGRRRDRREVRHLRRGPRAERPHALLREPRIGLRVRHLRPSARRRDGAGTGRVDHVRAASGAARSRHSRDDLREGSCRARRPNRSPDAFHAAYATEPFVRLTGDALPEIKHVAWTNFCDIGWRLDPATRRLVIVSCLDNLVKGAAGPGAAELQRRRAASTSGRGCCDSSPPWCSSSAASCSRRAADRARIAGARPRDRGRTRRSSIVHGGGRAIDAELARGRSRPKSRRPARHRRGHARRRRRGARRLGEHRTGRGARRGRRAGGRTDRRRRRLRPRDRSSAHRTTTGAIVDLGLVGDPADVDPALVSLLLRHGYVPVVASLGISDVGRAQRERRRDGVPAGGGPRSTRTW